MTKIACADRRHRLVLHSVDLGLALAKRAFPDRPEVEAVVEQHVEEDLGTQATLADWLEGCDLERGPRPLKRRLAIGKEGVIELVAGKLHPACEPTIGDIYDLLTLPLKFVPKHRELGLSVLMNAIGPGLVRRVLGPPHRIEHANGHVTVDGGWIAEAIIFAMYGGIPDLGHVVRTCTREPGRLGGAESSL